MQQNGQKGYEDYFNSIERSLLNEKTARPAVKQKPTKHTRKKSYKLNFVRIIFVFILLLAVVFSAIIIKSCNSKSKTEKTEKTEITILAKSAEKKEKKEKNINLFPNYGNNVLAVSDEVTSEAVIFIDDGKNKVIASRNSNKRMYPASTTKLMTLLVAVENIKDYKDTFTMTYQITDPLYKQGATVAGFSSSEVVNMNDLIYGTILPSGGDAAIGLAEKIAGSESAFVELMNKKAKQLGLKSTHFMNCTGLFDKNHFTTAEELAIILRANMQNPVCKKVLTTQKYTTSSTNKHPDGLPLENTLFKYIYGTEPEHAVILGGKTGFVNESGYCIASFGEDSSGNEFVCVTLNGQSRWPAVYDQINMYKIYIE